MYNNPYYVSNMGNCICGSEQEVRHPIPQEEAVYQNATDENTPYYSYENRKQKVKVLRVVDGDTVDIAMYHAETNQIFKYRVRLYGIDTPEKRPSKSDPNREKEIAASKQSSKGMTDKLQENKNIVTALFYKPDKYGRLLCTFYDNKGEDINAWMIQQGYATSYFGKTKKSYEEVCLERDDIYRIAEKKDKI